MGEFAAVFVALYAAHHVGDIWVQTQAQCNRKGLPGWPGRLACLAHVWTYTGTALVFLLALMTATRSEPGVVRLFAGLAVSAVTHYIADRREPLKRLAYAAGKTKDFVERGGGLYLLDQSWHIGWLFVAALVIAA